MLVTVQLKVAWSDHLPSGSTFSSLESHYRGSHGRYDCRSFWRHGSGADNTYDSLCQPADTIQTSPRSIRMWCLLGQTKCVALTIVFSCFYFKIFSRFEPTPVIISTGPESGKPEVVCKSHIILEGGLSLMYPLYAYQRAAVDAYL